MPKLLFVVNEASFFISHRLPIGRAARDAGYEVHVATPPCEKSAAVFEKEGFVFHPLSALTRKGTNPLQEVKACAQLWKLYRSITPDIVHHVTIKPVIYGGIISRLASVPAAVNAISGLGYVFIKPGIKGAVLRTIATLLYKLALGHKHSKVIFQNPDDKQHFIDHKLLSPNDIVMIKGSGVDVEHYQVKPEPEHPPVIVTLVARMLWDKGIGEFVEAARQLKQGGEQIECRLVGDTDPGNPAAIPQQTLQQWQQEGVINWLGRREDIAEIYAQTHIACLPSYREGLPKALIEAAACGRALISTDVPGCREVVNDGINGLLVPVRKSAPLAEAIKTLAADHEKRKRFAAESRKRAEEEFSVRLVEQQTLAIYAQLAPA